MIGFEVNDMRCGHCASAITEAVRAVCAQAIVNIDLLAHSVRIDAPGADARALADAISQAGYTPVPASAPSASVRGAGGCCSA